MKKIICLLLLLIPCKVYAVTLDEYNEAIVKVSLDMAQNYANEFVYTYIWGGTPENPQDKSDQVNGWLRDGYNGIKTKSGYVYGSTKSKAGVQGSFQNKFPVYCETFVRFVVYHTSGGAVAYPRDYETVKVSDLKPGDMIHFPNHIAVYIDDGGDTSNSTWRVSEASSKVQTRVLSNTPDKGYRLKAEALARLSYNTVTASYDFHDRLDDFAPIITSAKQDGNSDIIKLVAQDEKHYDDASRSDILEPENNGIVAYTVTKNVGVPETGWIDVTKTTYLNQDVKVDDNGTWNVWVKDVGGNVTCEIVTVTNMVHKENDKPKIEILSSLDDYQKTYELQIKIDDLDGLKEFSIGLSEEPNYKSVSEQNSYETSYEIEKNGVYYIYARDIYGNTSSITIEVDKIDQEKPVIDKLYQQEDYIYVEAHDYLSGVASYKINDEEWQSDSKFLIKKNGNYVISVKDKAGNIITGEIKVSGLSIFGDIDIYDYLIKGALIISVIILIIMIIRSMGSTSRKKTKY